MPAPRNPGLSSPSDTERARGAAAPRAAERREARRRADWAWLTVYREVMRSLSLEKRDRRPLWQRALEQRGQRHILEGDLVDPPCMFCGGDDGTCRWCETIELVVAS